MILRFTVIPTQLHVSATDVMGTNGLKYVKQQCGFLTYWMWLIIVKLNVIEVWKLVLANYKKTNYLEIQPNKFEFKYCLALLFWMLRCVM